MDIETTETTESLLLDEAREFLATQKGRFPRVAADTGLTLRFLHNLHQNVPNDPGVRKIEALLKYKAHLATIESAA